MLNITRLAANDNMPRLPAPGEAHGLTLAPRWEENEAVKSAMKNTYEPQLIYDMFAHYGFNVLRIDQFDSGSFAKIRAELNYELLSAGQLLEVATRLISMEKNENLDIQVVMVDMRHRTMTVNILVREQEATIIG